LNKNFIEKSFQKIFVCCIDIQQSLIENNFNKKKSISKSMRKKFFCEKNNLEKFFKFFFYEIQSNILKEKKITIKLVEMKEQDKERPK